MKFSLKILGTLVAPCLIIIPLSACNAVSNTREDIISILTKEISTSINECTFSYHIENTSQNEVSVELLDNSGMLTIKNNNIHIHDKKIDVNIGISYELQESKNFIFGLKIKFINSHGFEQIIQDNDLCIKYVYKNIPVQIINKEITATSHQTHFEFNILQLPHSKINIELLNESTNLLSLASKSIEVTDNSFDIPIDINKYLNKNTNFKDFSLKLSFINALGNYQIINFDNLILHFNPVLEDKIVETSSLVTNIYSNSQGSESWLLNFEISSNLESDVTILINKNYQYIDIDRISKTPQNHSVSFLLSVKNKYLDQSRTISYIPELRFINSFGAQQVVVLPQHTVYSAVEGKLKVLEPEKQIFTKAHNTDLQLFFNWNVNSYNLQVELITEKPEFADILKLKSSSFSKASSSNSFNVGLQIIDSFCDSADINFTLKISGTINGSQNYNATFSGLTLSYYDAIPNNLLKLSANRTKLLGVIEGIDLSPYRKLKIPESVTSISDNAFKGLFSEGSSIKSIILNDNLEKIGNSAFEGCNALEGPLSLPIKLKTIGSNAFNGCNQLTGSLTIPKSVEYIGSCSFKNTNFFGMLSFSGRPLTIEDSAFDEMIKNINRIDFTNLDKLPDPGSWSNNIFHDLKHSNIKILYMKNPNYSVDELAQFIQSIGSTIKFKSDCFDEILPIPDEAYVFDSVETTVLAELRLTSDLAQYNCIKIPEKTTKISSYFLARENFQHYYLFFNDKIEEIGDYAFNSAYLKENIIFPFSLKNIRNGAFRNLNNNDNNLCFTFNSKLTSIDESVFENSFAFSNPLILPSNISIIRKSTFKNAFKEDGVYGNFVYLPSNIEVIDDSAFEQDSGSLSFNNINIPNNLISIGKNAFKGCKNLTGSIILPDSLTSLGESAFEGCEKLDGKLKLSSNLSQIPNKAFAGCKNLKYGIKLPDSVTSIGDYAFQNAFTETENQGDLDLNKVESIGIGAFEGCKFGGDLILNNRIKKIDKLAFNNCLFNNKKIVIKNDSSQSISPEIFGTNFAFDMIDMHELSQIPEWMKNFYPYSLIFPDDGKVYYSKYIDLNELKQTFSNWGMPTDKWEFNESSEIEIPESCLIINNGEFKGIKKDINVSVYKNLTMPKNVIKIADNACFDAFKTEQSISKLDLNNELKYIGDFAFYNCSNLSNNLVIRDNVEYIGQAAFAKCSKLKKITFASSHLDLWKIGQNAFSECNNVNTLDLSFYAFFPEWLKAENYNFFQNWNSEGKVIYNKNLSSQIDELKNALINNGLPSTWTFEAI